MKWLKRWWLNWRLDSLRREQEACWYILCGRCSDDVRKQMAGFSKDIAADIEAVKAQIKVLG